ncbi:MAG: hypothetical protein JWM82_4020, partial [Myxococcales bacterium]|nr:hypothetical protein [Myxococcales bacterium]
MEPSTLKALLQTAAKIVPAVGPQIDKWRGKPSKADRDVLGRYVQRLDERRVFF